MRFCAAFILMPALTLLSGVSCSSGSDSPTLTGAVGGPVAGPDDDHCAMRPEGVSDPATCFDPGAASDSEGGASSNDGSRAAGAAGSSDCNLIHDTVYGDTLYNASGVDDDCKYNVSWTSTPIRKGENVTFTVTATSKSSGAPLEKIAGQPAQAVALSKLEPYVPCDPTHAPPDLDLRAPIKETAPGVFSVGPIVFDESGRWVVRFHFYESCLDSETSPHGHVAFFVKVP